MILISFYIGIILAKLIPKFISRYSLSASTAATLHIILTTFLAFNLIFMALNTIGAFFVICKVIPFALSFWDESKADVLRAWFAVDVGLSEGEVLVLKGVVAVVVAVMGIVMRLWQRGGWAAFVGRVGDRMAADRQQMAERGVAEKKYDGSL